MPNELNYSITQFTVTVECHCGHEQDILLNGPDDLDTDTTYDCDMCHTEFTLGSRSE